MKKTLLLCFIHGFKGGDHTFEQFPQDLRAILSHALPKVAVHAIIYPKFETRGDLHDCVSRFREWLQNKVIDLETANETQSPMISPSVHTILIGHSMGGIVAAETLLSIANEKPISSSGILDDASTLMFPYIQGVLAFDTPYLGIAPGVVAHSAEGHWNTASSLWATYNNVAGTMGYGVKAQPAPEAVEASKLLPAPTRDANADVASAPAWQKWGKMAMYAGAIGAVAAGGAAAYMKREQLSEGWTWVGSHLEFVGCLARGEELQRRVKNVIQLNHEQDIGFADMYTTLGAAVEGKTKWSSDVLGQDRTFCALPKSEAKKCFIETRNDAATSEIGAHTAMFKPKENPGYYAMREQAKDLIVEWKNSEWYEEGEKQPDATAGSEQGLEDLEDLEDEDMEIVEKPDIAETGAHQGKDDSWVK